MKDKIFLEWIYARLKNVHKEDPLMDYMHKLKAIINATDPKQETPNTEVTLCFDVHSNITFPTLNK